ncbi:MAG: diacylglycerol kinase family protein [Tannerella sp.]|jgi:diacylglycerol kinase (ATP)|nr:diacylglycerol kinase family protein [Tannerella sp.]
MYAEDKKGFSVKRLLNSFGYAFQGIFGACRERNARIHLFAACCAIVAGVCFRLSGVEWALIVMVIGGVFAMEIINTSIETLADVVSPSYQKQIKAVKDLAAGAVLVMAIVAAVTGLLIFAPKIINLF